MSRSPRQRVVAAWLSAVVLVFADGPGAHAADDRAVLARAGAQVARYARLLPHLVAEETMTQHLRPRRGRQEEPVNRRVVSDLGWVRLDGIDEPLALRDVQSVDWEPVPRIRGARSLRGARRATTDEARALLDAAARYNLAPGTRNINIPTFVFFFLLPEWQPRFSWKRQSPRDAEVWEFSFRERERPTVIRTETRKPVFSRGRVWIQRETGEVLRTLLDVRVEGNDYTLETRFAPVERLGLTLPVEMTETYGAGTFVVQGAATYDNYRRFTTEARVIGQ